jgi:hypothetical protein
LEIIDIYSDNHRKYINKQCGNNAEMFNADAGGTYSYHCALNCYGKLPVFFKDILPYKT